jgi:hypothetical protein
LCIPRGFRATPHGRSEDDETIPFRAPPARQGGEAGTRPNGEAFTQLWMQPQDRAVMSGIRNEQDQQVRPEITLLRGCPPLDELEVAEVRLCLDERIPGTAIDQPVAAPSIAGDGDRHFNAPSQHGMQPGSEATKQGELALIPNGVAVRMEAYRELKSKRRREPRKKVDRLRNGLASFQARDSSRTNAEPPRQLTLAEPRGKSRLDQLRREPLAQLPATALPDRNSTLAHGHGPIMTHSPYPLVTPLIHAWVIRRRSLRPRERPASDSRLQTLIVPWVDQTTKERFGVVRVERTPWPASSFAPFASQTPTMGRRSVSAGPDGA